jgi:hypothetical protein
MTALRTFTAPVLLALCLLAGAGTADAAVATDTFSGEVISDEADRALAIFDARFSTDDTRDDTRDDTIRTAATAATPGVSNVPELASLALVLAAAACMFWGRSRGRRVSGAQGSTT